MEEALKLTDALYAPCPDNCNNCDYDFYCEYDYIDYDPHEAHYELQPQYQHPVPYIGDEQPISWDPQPFLLHNPISLAPTTTTTGVQEGPTAQQLGVGAGVQFVAGSHESERQGVAAQETTTSSTSQRTEISTETSNASSSSLPPRPSLTRKIKPGTHLDKNKIKQGKQFLHQVDVAQLPKDDQYEEAVKKVENARKCYLHRLKKKGKSSKN